MFFIPSHITVNFILGITTPYMPILMRNLGYSAAMVGVLLAVSEGAGILGPFLFGRLADRSGKYKGVIVLAYFLVAAAALPLAKFSHPAISAVLIAVFAVGLRSAMPLIDALTTINLGEKGNYGKIRVSGSIAFASFVFFLQWTPVLRPNTPQNISLWILMITMLAIVVTILVPSKYTTRISQRSSPHESILNDQKKSIWTPFFILGLTIIALSRVAMTSVYSFFPLYMVEYMQWDAVGSMLALAVIAEIPFIYFSSRLIRRFSPMPILAFSCAMVAVRLGLYAVFPFKAGIIIAQLLHSFCFGLFHPAAVAFISACVPPEQRSFGMTLYLSVGCGIPALIGNFIGGFIADQAGYRFLFGSFTIFGILGAVIYVIYRLRETTTKAKLSPRLP